MRGLKEGAPRRKSYGKALFPHLQHSSTDDYEDATTSPSSKRDDYIDIDVADFKRPPQPAVDPVQVRVTISVSHFTDIFFQDPEQAAKRALALMLGHELLAQDISVHGPLWLHGTLDRDAAEDLLHDTAEANPVIAEGLFLVRASSKGEAAYSLDIYHVGEVCR